MRSEAVVPISPEVAEQLEQARLTSAFDALYEAGGATAANKALGGLKEHLRDLIKSDQARCVVRPGNDGWIA